MKWLRLFLAILILAGAVGFVWITRGQDDALFLGIGIILAFGVFSIVADDSHARWLASTRNVPVWGLFIAIPVTIILVAPVIFKVGKGVVEAFVAVFEVQTCIPATLFIVVLVSLVVLYNRRNRRRNTPTRRTTPAAPAATGTVPADDDDDDTP